LIGLDELLRNSPQETIGRGSKTFMLITPFDPRAGRNSSLAPCAKRSSLAT
jgi:hypothetical protein